MSEPVGNGPRSTGDIPGNSHKARKEITAKEEEAPRESVEKIVVGKVVTKKQPWWKRIARSMVADDAQNIGDFILVDVIVPATKNLIRDIIFSGTERTLYGSSRARRSVGLGLRGEVGSLRTRYDRMSDGPGEPRRTLSREARARHDFDDVVLDDREEAIAVVETLIMRVDKYGSASVADLYDLVGVTGSYADRRYGWSNLSDADVRQSRGGWLLDLPRPEPLSR